MRRWRLQYSASPPLASDGRRDPRPKALLEERFDGGGWVVTSVEPAHSGATLVVECEGDGDPPRTGVDGLRLVRVEDLGPAQAPRPLEPPLVEPDPSVPSPVPRPWSEWRALGDRALAVTFSRGVNQRLHSVRVDETPDEAVVTLDIGTFPTPPTEDGLPVFIPLVAIVEAVRVELDAPIGQRRIRDGAPS